MSFILITAFISNQFMNLTHTISHQLLVADLAQMINSILKFRKSNLLNIGNKKNKRHLD